MKTSLIIPAYNEEHTIGTIIEQAQKYVDEIIVIDDASTDNTYSMAKQSGAKTIRNKTNKGTMISTTLGIKKAKYDTVIRMDADGQHNPGDIPKILQKTKSSQLVLGTRNELPRLGENIMAHACKVRDATTGFIAFNKSKLGDIIEQDKYWGAGTILRAKNRGLKLAQVPIRTEKRQYGKSTHSSIIVFLKSLVFFIKAKIGYFK